MRAAIYTRVSQDRNRVGRSVGEQEAEARAQCEREGWDVTAVYTDNDRSASRYARKTRPEFERLLSQLSDFDVIVTWEASRATRDLEVYVRMREACRAAGTKWAYNGRVFDFDRTDDTFNTGIDMLIAERESGETSKRVQRAVRAQATAGKPHGRIPFGYTRVYDPATGALARQVPHPEESKLLAEAADRVLNGESLYAIAKDFRSRGWPTMDGHRLHRLLSSPTYAGQRVYRGKVIGTAEWEPIIPPERWEAVQAVLDSPDRGKFHGSEPAYLLTGIATCGVCGGAIIRLLNRGKYAYYICKKEYCVSRSQAGVDAVVVAVVKRILTSPDALEAIHAQADPDVSGLAREVQELDARLEALYAQAADGSLSPSGLARVESSVLAKLDAAKERLRAMSTPRRITIADPADTAARWEKLPLLTQREIVRALMEVRILPAKTKGVRFDPQSVEIRQRL